MPLRLFKPSFVAPTMRASALVLAAMALSSCAEMSKVEFFPAFRGEAAPTPAAVETQPLDPLNAAPPVAAAALDPLNAPPPPTATTVAAGDPSKVDPLKVDPMAASAAPKGGSQMVPLGSLNASDKQPAPKRNGPAPLIPNAPQPTPQPAPVPQPVAQAAPVVATPTPTPAPVAAAPMPAPAPAAPVAAPPATLLQLAAKPATAQPETMAAMPAPIEQPKRTTLSEFFNRTSPTTDQAVAQPGSGTLIPAPALPEAREFVPAQISVAQPMTAGATMGAPKLSVGENNIIRRFQVLARLLDEGLMTQEEFDKRRAANIGALLPYSKEPPAAGLDRSVPAPAAISARLQALGRSLEMRAISARQHELERSTILNSLLPERPDPRAPKMPPPSDMFALADAAARLGYLREESLIGEGEFDNEKTSMDRVMRGSDPIERKSVASNSKANPTNVTAKPAMGAAGKEMAGDSNAPAAPETFTGPVLHLASFRSAEGARSGFEQAKTKNPEVFANLRMEARRTQIPGQGTFYRLLVGPFASLTDAEATCVEMKKMDQFCRPSADGS